MKHLQTLVLTSALAVAALAMGAPPTGARADDEGRRTYRHVLLISIDGMHALDLENYVSAHPQSNLARLSAHGIVYPNALSSAPSDSFPGLLALVTGGTPKSTGVYYDNSYDRKLFAPGSNCQGPMGTQVLFDENIDKNPLLVTGGGYARPAAHAN